NPFDVAVATPTPLKCGSNRVTPLTIAPTSSDWPTHDDISVVATIGSCADPASPITAKFTESFTAPSGCVAPPGGSVTTTLASGTTTMVPAQYVAVPCKGNWSVKVTVTNT